MGRGQHREQSQFGALLRANGRLHGVKRPDHGFGSKYEGDLRLLFDRYACQEPV